MSKSETIKVTAAPGRLVPIHPSIKSGLGGKQLRIKPGDIVELPNNSTVRRRIVAGDLVLVKADAKKATTLTSSKE